MENLLKCTASFKDEVRSIDVEFTYDVETKKLSYETKVDPEFIPGEDANGLASVLFVALMDTLFESSTPDTSDTPDKTEETKTSEVTKE